jgi:hypothetical protein
LLCHRTLTRSVLRRQRLRSAQVMAALQRPRADLRPIRSAARQAPRSEPFWAADVAVAGVAAAPAPAPPDGSAAAQRLAHSPPENWEPGRRERGHRESGHRESGHRESGHREWREAASGAHSRRLSTNHKSQSSRWRCPGRPGRYPECRSDVPTPDRRIAPPPDRKVRPPWRGAYLQHPRVAHRQRRAFAGRLDRPPPKHNIGRAASGVSGVQARSSARWT